MTHLELLAIRPKNLQVCRRAHDPPYPYDKKSPGIGSLSLQPRSLRREVLGSEDHEFFWVFLMYSEVLHMALLYAPHGVLWRIGV